MFFNIPSNPNITDIPGLAISKSKTLAKWFPACVDGLQAGTTAGCSWEASRDGGPVTPTPGTDIPVPPGTSNPSETKTTLDKLKVEEPQKVDYDREEWNHWTSQGSGCWDTRDKVLYDEAVKGSVVLADKNKKTTTDLASACSVTSGKWLDPYTGVEITNPKELDIDHMIPLSYAAKHGGQAWSEDKKEQFANDLSNPQHLLAVKLSENRTKGDKGPGSWRPSNTAYQCQYATDWIGISTNYSLSISSADKKALTEMLATCK